MKSVRSQQSITGILFVAPMVCCVAGVLIYPFLNGVFLSFTNKMFTHESYSLVGLENYAVLLHDELFFLALGHSLKFTFFGVLGSVLLGLLFALLLKRNTRLTAFFRGLLFLSWTLPSIVVALTFRWLYNDFYGYINYMLQKHHLIEAPFNILADRETAWIGVLIPLVWCFFPFAMIFLLSALQSIDETLYRVAEMDGATSWDMFWHITLPLLVPSLIVAVILEAIWMFCSFDLVYLLTNGGPGYETLTLSLYIYQQAFGAKNMAYGAALSTVMFAFLMICTFGYFKIAGNRLANES